MGKTSFQNIEKLIREIESRLDQLKQGKLLVDELNDLVKMSADLHERLAVLRHKAYEKFGEPQDSSIPLESPKEQETESFDFSAMQTDVVKENQVEENSPVVEESEESISFSGLSFDLPEKDTPAKVEVKKPLHVIREETKPVTSVPLHEKFLKEEEPLNDKLKQDGDLPLRKKLGLTPVKDIRAEIGIGKKFEYINFLFGGDAKAYDTAIDELNNCGSAEIARQKLNVYSSVYKWNMEDKTIIKFIELVDRRFIS